MTHINHLFSSILIITFFLTSANAQHHLPCFGGIDIQHYAFDLKLNDENDVTTATAISSPVLQIQ